VPNAGDVGGDRHRAGVVGRILVHEEQLKRVAERIPDRDIGRFPNGEVSLNGRVPILVLEEQRMVPVTGFVKRVSGRCKRHRQSAAGKLNTGRDVLADRVLESVNRHCGHIAPCRT
jgi:hypothetical protein